MGKKPIVIKIVSSCNGRYLIIARIADLDQSFFKCMLSGMAAIFLRKDVTSRVLILRSFPSTDIEVSFIARSIDSFNAVVSRA
jgi:hypothetical protein